MADPQVPPVQADIEARALALGMTAFQIKSLTASQRTDLARLLNEETALQISVRTERWVQWKLQLEAEIFQIHVIADRLAMADKGQTDDLAGVLAAPARPPELP